MRRKSPSRKLLDALIEDATTDAYGEYEQRYGFCVMLDEHLEMPFETKIFGVVVIVSKIETNDADEIVAICQRGRESLRIPVLDLPLPDPPPEGWQWIEAYRRWARGA
jgi:hypothetical protein